MRRGFDPQVSGPAASIFVNGLRGLLTEWRRTQLLYLTDEIGHVVSEFGALRRRYPLDTEALRFDAHKLQKLPHENDALAGHEVAVHVMTITEMTPAHKNPVNAFLKGLEDVVRRNRAGEDSRFEIFSGHYFHSPWRPADLTPQALRLFAA